MERQPKVKLLVSFPPSTLVWQLYNRLWMPVRKIWRLQRDYERWASIWTAAVTVSGLLISDLWCKVKLSSPSLGRRLACRRDRKHSVLWPRWLVHYEGRGPILFCFEDFHSARRLETARDQVTIERELVSTDGRPRLCNWFFRMNRI